MLGADIAARARALKKFDPLRISGWEFLADLSLPNACVADSSSRISQINDISGKGKHATQSTDANKACWSGGTNRENLAIGTEAFDGSAWAKARCNVVGNTVANPRDGAQTANTHREDASNNSHQIYNNVGLLVVSGVRYSWSVNIKKITRHAAFRFESQFSGYAFFDLDNGTVQSVTGNVGNASVVSLGNGWYRIYAECTATATGYAYFDVYPTATPGGSTSYQGVLNQETFYLDAAQVRSTLADPDYLPNPGAAPLYRSLNGNRCAVFDGVDDRYDNFSFAGLNGDDNPFTLIAVAQHSIASPSVAECYCGVYDTNYIAPRSFFWRGSAGVTEFYQQGGADGSGKYVNSAMDASTIAQVRAVVCAGKTATHYKNGVISGTPNADSDLGVKSGLIKLIVGAHNYSNSYSSFLCGKLAFLGINSRALSLGELQYLNNGLRARFRV